MKKYLAVIFAFILLCLLHIPIITFADFALIDSSHVDKFFREVDDLSTWWDKTGDSEMVTLWHAVLLDVVSYDPSYDVKSTDALLAIIGLDRKNSNIHLYMQDRSGNYRHIEFYTEKGSDKSLHDYLYEIKGELIYEIEGISLSKAREKLKNLTDVQYEVTFDTATSILKGD